MLVPSKQDLVAVEVELVDDPDRPYKLRDALAELLARRSRSTTSSSTARRRSASSRSTRSRRPTAVLVPMQCEYYALEGLTALMATIDRVRGGMNPRLEVEGIVLTMFDPRNNLAHQVADEVKRHFRVFDSVIPRNVRLSEAPSHGKPALLYDVQSKGAQGYLSLARELLARAPQARRSREARRDERRRTRSAARSAAGSTRSSRPRRRRQRYGDKSVFTCPLEKIVPQKGQPRQHFDAQKLDELAQSIREHGLVEPLVVRRVPAGATSSSSSPASAAGARCSARGCARRSSSSRT